MRTRVKLIAIAALVAVATTTGCTTVKKLASGQKVTQADLVREADKGYQEHEREQQRIADTEKRIDKELKAIAELREKGNFSSAEYREKNLERQLEQLKELDSDNAKLAEAPKELEAIKAKFSKEVYERKALADNAGKLIQDAKNARMEEQWRRVDDRLDRYIKNRRKLVDAGGDPATVAEHDKTAIEEFDHYAEFLLKQSEENRKQSNFRHAVGFEGTLERLLAGYKEIDANSAKPDQYAESMQKTRMTYRDPEEVAAERAQGAYEAWKKNATEAFNADWEKIQAAEQAARPAYEEGLAALNKGEYDAALTKLLAARQTLYETAYPSAVAFDAAVTNGSLTRGLSYEIAGAIARVHFEQGHLAALYPELAIIQSGRSWMSKDEELQIRLFETLADRQDRLAPKASDTVKRYASRYSNDPKTWRLAKDHADATAGEAYMMLGVALETISHRHAASNAEENAGKVVYVEEPVTAVANGKLRFDFRQEYKVPSKCWTTNKVSSVNWVTGDVYYEEKCKYKTVKDGYILIVAAPKDVKIKKGDIVSFYATVGKKAGKADLHLNEPAFLRLAPGGKTAWYLGARVK